MKTVSRWLATVLAATLMASMLLAGPAVAQDATVDVVDFAYDAFDTVVEVGDTVEFTNVGAAAHTVTATDGTFDEVLNPGETFEYTVEEAGEINYYCVFHGTPNDGQYGFLTAVGEGEDPPEARPAPAPPEFAGLPTGEDNVDAAIAWTARLDDGSAPEVILGRDDDFADLLAAGATGLPFLVTATDALDDRVLAELTRLGAQTVHIVGGTAAVSEDVATALQDEGFTVERVAGPTRVETATQIGTAFFDGEEATFAQPPGPPPMQPGALIARAFGAEDNPTAGFADSLGAASAGAVLDTPVLVTGEDGLAEAVLTYLQDNDIGHVAVIGGEAAVPAAVTDDLTAAGITFQRVAGPARDATAAALQAYVDALGGQYGTVAIVDGFNADAWAQGFGAAAVGSTVLLTNGDLVPELTQDQLSGFEGSVLMAFVGAKDVLCAPGVTPAACGLVGTVVTTSFTTPTTLVGFMEGSEEPDGGHPVASGLFGFTAVPDSDAVCYAYESFALQDIVGAHIHRAPEGESGDVVVPFSVAGAQDGEMNGCLTDVDPALVQEIFADPGEFYINLHTPEFPPGAIRDNLFVFNDFYVADLSGNQQVPGPGADAVGVAFLTFNEDNDVCHFTAAPTGEPPQAEHIHSGGPDESGEVLIPLSVSPAGLPVHVDCIEDTDQDAAATFQADPADHYVNVHSESFPEGAIRGQANPIFVVPPS